jgi:hypothetical protein
MRLNAKEIEAASARTALDAWLDAPSAEAVRYEEAVMRELGGGDG